MVSRSGGTWYLLILNIKFATWLETCFTPFIWIFQKQDSPAIKLIGSFFLDINWWTGCCPGSGESYLPNTEAQAAEVAAEAAAEGDTEAPKYGALQSSLGDSALKSSIYKSAGGDFSINGYHNSLWKWPTGCF